MSTATSQAEEPAPAPPQLRYPQYGTAYLVPPVMLDAARFLRDLVRYRDALRTIRANAEIRRDSDHDTVYVLANGPSLNNFDVSRLRGQDAIVMNHFELAPWKSTVRIVAHCIGEPANSPAWEDPTQSIIGTDAESYWFHVSARAALAPLQLPPGKRLRYVLANVEPGIWRGRINLARPVLAYQTTAQLAIMVALHLGYSRVNLLGFDHDWLATPKLSPHFYAERKGVPVADLSQFTYHELIRFSERMWRIYYALHRSASEVGVRVVNLSRPSLLDVFEREPTG